MRLRTVQLACLLLLLSSLGVAEAPARGTDLSLGGHYIRAILQQSARDAAEPSGLSRSFSRSADLALAPVARFSPVTTMRPPSAQAIGVRAVTASGL